MIESQNGLARRSPELIAKTHEIILALRAGKTVPDVPPELANVFGPDALTYTRSQINIDPPAELAKVTVPILVLQGDNDLQVGVDDAKSLAARSGGKLVIVAGMTHVLKTASAKFADNVKTYTDPTLPLAPEVIPAVADFIRAASPR